MKFGVENGKKEEIKMTTNNEFYEDDETILRDAAIEMVGIEDADYYTSKLMEESELDNEKPESVGGSVNQSAGQDPLDYIQRGE